MKEQILQQLRESRPWQDSLIWFDSIGSTNTAAKKMATEGAPHGTVLIAGQQSAGRGRRGRSFHSPAGAGIYMSLILRPGCAPTELMHLTCAVAVAMCDAVEHSAGFRPGIKWTNDLVHGHRKLAGVLTELGLNAQGRTDYAIVGVGINCTQAEADFPEDIRSIAGSLSAAAGHPIDRVQVAAAMLDALYRMDAQLLTGKAEILDQYRRDCITLGKAVAVISADGTVRHGKALDINEAGALAVAFPGGIEIVNSGEVSVRGMYGYL